VYDAYRLGTDRDALHQLLAERFTGEALTTQYVEHWTTLARMERESTAIDIKRVSYASVEVQGGTDSTAEVHAAWHVGGVVTHRGHKHARVNAYRARYDMVRTPDGPRISATHLQALQRVAAAADLDLDGSGNLPATDAGFLDAADLIEAGMLEGLE
jgi:hypothetical protein